MYRCLGVITELFKTPRIVHLSIKEFKKQIEQKVKLKRYHFPNCIIFRLFIKQSIHFCYYLVWHLLGILPVLLISVKKNLQLHYKNWDYIISLTNQCNLCVTNSFGKKDLWSLFSSLSTHLTSLSLLYNHLSRPWNSDIAFIVYKNLITREVTLAECNVLLIFKYTTGDRWKQNCKLEEIRNVKYQEMRIQYSCKMISLKIE